MKLLKTLLIIFYGILSLVISQFLASLIFKLNLGLGLSELLFGLIYLILNFGLIKLFIEKFLKEDLADYRIKPAKSISESVLIGVILPLLVMITTMFIVPGEFSLNQLTLDEKLSSLFFAIFSAGLAAALSEELVFRGLIMGHLEKNYSRGLAVVLPSIVFGLIHLLNGSLDFSSEILLILSGSLVGIMFSLIALRFDSILASSLVHGFWNLLIIGGIIYIGSEPNPRAILEYRLSSSNLFLTGGQFGIEASIISILGYLTVSILVHKSIKGKKEG